MLPRVQVTAEDFLFFQVRNTEYMIRVKMAEAQKAAAKKLDGSIVISVSPCHAPSSIVAQKYA